MSKTAQYAFAVLAVGASMLTSCSTNLDDSYDPYENWQARNEAWFKHITDSAKTCIADAQAKYPNDWEDHCSWRIYRSLLKSTSSGTGSATDSIVVHINCNHWIGTYYPASNVYKSPTYSDTVCISYRGYLMPTKNYGSDGNLELRQERFTSTYYGADDDISADTSAPGKSSVTSFAVDGFASALMRMTPGDDWTVYIPNNLAYGKQTTGLIQPYSTLQFRIFLYDWHEIGTAVPVWKARER